jgi:glucose/arabinose dehydrogenase
MKDGRPSGDSQILLTGFIGTEKILSPEDARYRAMGLTEMPDGSILVVDSVQGKIWKLSRDKGAEVRPR